MPGYDGTGPMGMGPMTGGGWGPCNRYGGGAYGFGGFGRGRGFRRGLGRGFGRGRGFVRGFGRQAFSPAWGAWGGAAYGTYQAGPYAADPDEELRTLREEARAVRNDLEAITKRIQELESQSPAS